MAERKAEALKPEQTDAALKCPSCGSDDVHQHDYRKMICEACGTIASNEEFGGELVHSLDGTPQTSGIDPNAIAEPSAVEANARGRAFLKGASAGKTEQQPIEVDGATPSTGPSSA